MFDVDTAPHSLVEAEGSDLEQTCRLNEVIAGMDVALKAATSPHDFKLLVAAEGRTSTTMDDVAEARDRNSLAA